MSIGVENLKPLADVPNPDPAARVINQVAAANGVGNRKSQGVFFFHFPK